jgi:hypothetical protein
LAPLFAIVDFAIVACPRTLTVVALDHRNKSLLFHNQHKRIHTTHKMIIPIRCFSCGKVSG